LPLAIPVLYAELPLREGLQRKSFWRSQKIEAESPVFFGVSRKKRAQILILN
jgi:hypothetical protein